MSLESSSSTWARRRRARRSPERQYLRSGADIGTATTIATDWSSPDTTVRSALQSPSLVDLPDAAAATLAAYLDAHSLCGVVWSTRDVAPPLVEAFQRCVQLRLRPDAARQALLVQLIQAHHALATQEITPTLQRNAPTPPVLPSHFAIADTEEASTLVCITSHVRGLTISSNEYTAWPERPFRWDLLQQFIALERLEVDHVWDRPLDLAVLSNSMPQLQELVIKRARSVTNRLVGLTTLRVLHVEDTNLDSFAIAVGLPRLQSLTLLTTPYRYRMLRHVSSLAEVAPLTRLAVRGLWDQCPREAMEKHVETLREYTELDDTLFDQIRRDVHPAWSTLVHLRSLRMGRFAQADMTPFTVLVALEELQLVVAKAARHCRPLRHLTRLRALQIANGWVCDLVGYLPRLETLVWEACSLSVEPDYRRLRLYRREQPERRDGNDEASVRRNANGEGVGIATRLRKLVLRGDVYIVLDWTSVPSVDAMLEHVEHVEVHEMNTLSHVESVLEEIAKLRHVKRLLFQDASLPLVAKASERRVLFASAKTLEELYYKPSCSSRCATLQPAPFPLWFHDRLPNLRVLASPFRESLIQLAPLCPRLTHLHIPHSLECSFPEAPRESLRRLCVVTLAVSYDCAWLRNECGPGRLLPSLRRIFHPTTDCLCASTCGRHRLALLDGRDYAIKSVVDTGNTPLTVTMYLVLLATWGYTRLWVFPRDLIYNAVVVLPQVNPEVSMVFLHPINAMLCMLQLLHIYWYVLFLFMGYMLLKTGKQEDIQQVIPDKNEKIKKNKSQ